MGPTAGFRFGALVASARSISRSRGQQSAGRHCSALTRPGPPIDIVDLYRKKDPWITRFYGANFDLTLAPSRPYEGVIRDRDSGAPIPGVLIESYRLADSKIGNYTLIKTRSDTHGRFRLVGMPLGTGNEVVLSPPEDQPYLLAQYKLPSAGEMKPIKIDLVLKRGIWLRRMHQGQGHGQAGPSPPSLFHVLG